MMGILAQCEFSMGKTLMVYDMNLREMENYEKIYTNIGRKYGLYVTDLKYLRSTMDCVFFNNTRVLAFHTFYVMTR